MSKSDDAGEWSSRDVARDLWERTLSQVPSTFGRLVFLASLRDDNSGKYQHYGLSIRFSTTETDGVLRENHEAVFREWLAYSLARQKADLDLYLSGLEGSKRETIEAWLALKPFRSAIPTRVRSPELQLFLSDIEALLEVLKAESGAASPDPDA
ncbi:MAG: hypothetical protein ABI693_27640 [Bryobacteraceae bacterium]